MLGLGDIGPLGALPVMEGKCMLFKQFGGIDAFPITLDTKNVDEIVETCMRIAPVFGGISLEDISSPRCFEVEARLIEALDIPVMHDDQHGTAVVILAAMINAAAVVGKRLEDMTIVLNGSGAAGNGDDQDAARLGRARRDRRRSGRRDLARPAVRQAALDVACEQHESRPEARRRCATCSRAPMRSSA